MKFSTSTALFALSAATMVVAAPMPAATTGASKDSNAFRQVDVGNDAFFAALLDPTFEDGADSSISVAAASAAASKTVQVMSTFGFGAGLPAARIVVPTSKVSLQAAKPTPVANNVQTAAPKVVTQVKYTTGPVVISTVPGKTSTVIKYSYYSVPAQSKFVTSTRVASATSTVIVSKSTNVYVTVPGKTSVVTVTNNAMKAQGVASTVTVTVQKTGAPVAPVYVTVPGKTATVTKYMQSTAVARPAY